MIKFYFDKDKLKAEAFNANSSRKSMDWLGKNIGNSAIQVAETQGVYWAKNGLYKLVAGVPQLVTAKELLSMNLECDQYGYMLRNAVVFKLSPSVSVALEDVRIDYNKENTIVSTPLVGRKDTIKEFIQGGDYNITVIGSLFSDQNKPTSFPIKQLKGLVDVLSSEGSVEVANVQLNELDVSRVVVKRFDIMQSKFVNMIDFRLVLLSDEDYKLELD